MYKCRDCSNTETFITERWYPHWVHVDGEGRVITLGDVQGDEDSHVEPLSGPGYIECDVCNSTNIEED